MYPYIIAVRKEEDGPLKTLRDREGKFKMSSKDQIEIELRAAGDKYGSDNVFCFKEVKVVLKTDVTFDFTVLEE